MSGGETNGRWDGVERPYTREDVERVQEPRFQALLETTAEVLTGLKKAYQDYDKKNEKAWRG